MQTCEHKNFACTARIARLTDNSEKTVTGYSAEIKIKCTECNAAFEFIGVDGGYSPFEPRVSADSTELRIPIKPSTGTLIIESNSKLN